MTRAEAFEDYCAWAGIDETHEAIVQYEAWLASEPDPPFTFDSRSEERLDALDRMDIEQ